MSKRYTIAIDFDGTLHPYTAGWTGLTPEHEPPTKGAAEAIAMLAQTHDIVIFSSRCTHPGGVAGVWAWLREYGLERYVKDVTCQKPAALAYIDDRAVPFTGDWSEAVLATKALVRRGPWNRHR